MTREMSRKQFHEALARNGFEPPVLFWVRHRDLPNHNFSMLFHRKGKIARRATVAHLIKCRNDELQRAAHKAKAQVAA